MRGKQTKECRYNKRLRTTDGDLEQEVRANEKRYGAVSGSHPITSYASDGCLSYNFNLGDQEMLSTVHLGRKSTIGKDSSQVYFSQSSKTIINALRDFRNKTRCNYLLDKAETPQRN